jgi:hypothetical protein
MKNNKEKTLQKFTEIEKLFEKNKIELDDIKGFNKEQMSKFCDLFNQKSKGLEGLELDKFYQKTDALLNQESKNQIWQSNHVNIIWSIHKLIQEYNRMPSITDIAKIAELSRPTVTKHLRDFSTLDLFKNEIDKYHIMLYSLMDKLYLEGVQCRNVKAIRLYFEILTYKTDSIRGKFNQNNYVQINNTKIDKVIIEHLPNEAKKEIEKIILANQTSEITGEITTDKI